MSAVSPAAIERSAALLPCVFQRPGGALTRRHRRMTDSLRFIARYLTPLHRSVPQFGPLFRSASKASSTAAPSLGYVMLGTTVNRLVHGADSRWERTIVEIFSPCVWWRRFMR